MVGASSVTHYTDHANHRRTPPSTYFNTPVDPIYKSL